jgi:LuxR family maltose regulon positive regulatory protein
MEGRLQDSGDEIEKAVDLMQTAAPSLVGEEVVAQQVSISLALGRSAEAQSALQPYGFRWEKGFSYPELGHDAPLSHPRGLLYNSALRILLHQARKAHEHSMLKKGVDLAGLVLQGSFRARHLPIALQTLLLRAQLYTAIGEDRAGLADVARALELAEPEGFISLFLEEGQPVTELVAALLKSRMPGSVKASYVQKILADFPKAQSIGTVSSRAVDPDLAPVEPLTSRELEVLQLIAAGDSNQAIADKLVITLSAVKKHTGNIFNKLNVNNRTQAVARARILGLLAMDD